MASSVLITGTSKGIGMATALAFGRAKYTVYATMRDPQRSPELAQIAAKEQLPIRILPMDVDSDQYLQMRAATNDEDWVSLGALDDAAWAQAFNMR